MAKVKGALHSDSASGQFAKTMIFRRGKKSTTVTNFYNPGSTNKFEISLEQIAQREKYRLGLDLWNSLPVEEKENWNLLVKFGFVIV